MRILIYSIFIFAFVFTSYAQEKKEKKDDIIVIKVFEQQNFEIKLEANKTTGYQWGLLPKYEKSIVKYLKNEYKQNDKKTIGSGGIEIWNFTAIKKGKTLLIFTYSRPWEKDVKPIKKIKYRIVVQKK